MPEQSGETDRYQLLEAAEQQRVDRFSSANERNRQINLRADLRQILANYLEIPAVQLKLSRTELDKPILTPHCYSLDLRFNLSHSGDRAILAIALGYDIGVDLEQLSKQRMVLPLARRYFCEPLVTAIAQHSGKERQQLFLRAWTQYEAYKKAQGVGLRGGDPKLSLRLEPYPANQFRPLFDHSPRWLTAALQLSEEWIAAVVIDSGGDRQRWRIIDHYHQRNTAAEGC